MALFFSFLIDKLGPYGYSALVNKQGTKSMTIYKLTCQFQADSADRIRRMWCQSPSLELVNEEAATIEHMEPAIERMEAVACSV